MAADVSATATSGQGITIPIPDVSGPNAGPIRYKRVGGPRNGVGEFVTEAGGTSFFYQSRSNFTGVEAIRYVALNDEGRPSSVATIAIDVQAPSAPAALKSSQPSGSGGAS